MFVNPENLFNSMKFKASDLKGYEDFCKKLYLMTNKTVKDFAEFQDHTTCGLSLYVIFTDGTKEKLIVARSWGEISEWERTEQQDRLKAHLPYADRRMREVFEGI